ncbi:hypothetical protein K438DRAFT_1811628 [Mycena galopus ATCC 62051]|nr:hypothetical protein K438DRAFT_1811628 [Mycena galopus ATCC 62051]
MDGDQAYRAQYGRRRVLTRHTFAPFVTSHPGTTQSADPPTFHEAQFDIFLRRQCLRPRDSGGL